MSEDQYATWITVLEKLLLLGFGGLLTVLGGWFKDLRGERTRKAHRLEEAYLAWLNTQNRVVSALVSLAERAEREPDSADSMQILLDRCQGVQDDLLKLGESTNAAFLYESKGSKRRLLEGYSRMLGLVANTVEVVLQHHREHLSFRRTVERAKDLVERHSALAEDAGVAGNLELQTEVQEKLAVAVTTRTEAEEHLSNCSRHLSTDVRTITSDVRGVIEHGRTTRELLVR
ncbi:MAG TPA: hypothetical protein VMY76_11790 [Gemmatimonadales bacterium]|nr:hypothetical protein [Gemmatimonadales bacterium]